MTSGVWDVKIDTVGRSLDDKRTALDLFFLDIYVEALAVIFLPYPWIS